MTEELKERLEGLGIEAEVDPILESWLLENRWFLSDRLLNKYAIELESELAEKRSSLSRGERLSEVSREIERRFPDRIAGQQLAN